MRIKFSHSTRFIYDILWCSYTWACSVRLIASTFMFVSALIYLSTVNETVTRVMVKGDIDVLLPPSLSLICA